MPSESAPTSAIVPLATASSVTTRKIASSDTATSAVPWTLAFAMTTLLGAFLSFQVQPVISKCVLPWFGGTPAVWTTCMLFFQVLLFGGYLYAHVLKTYFRPIVQAGIHLSLLAASALMLPIEPQASWQPTGSESPMLHLLWMLVAHVGAPYFVLASTGPLVQAWLSYHDKSDRVYRLYALSNIGSLAALLSYPFVVEPLLSVSIQSMAWSLTFCLFVLVQGLVAISLFRVKSKVDITEARDEKNHLATVERYQRFAPLAWMLLPALASVMLLVVTNHVCQDVAVIPFLWILPLGLYLVTFILCFDSPHTYHPKLYAAITLAATGAIQLKTYLPGSLQLLVEASCYMVLLFSVCMMCHGEVVRIKPNASHLTRFYAFISAGGALGGIVVAVVCPMVLNNFGELPFFLSLVTSFAFVLFFASQTWRGCSYDWEAAKRLRLPAVALMVAPLIAVAVASSDEELTSERNFFGVVRVIRDTQGTRLVHGSTIHGIQRSGLSALEPTSYYGRTSGVGLAIGVIQEAKPAMKMGVVGLGCGVLAAYGRSGDVFDMIEINPAVVRIANEHFSFLKDSAATNRTHLGDGRLVLERMPDADFDLLVLDAFSSDAIPAHLLTRESMALYRERLSPSGMIAIHVSNNHLDLVPLVHRLADDGAMVSKVVRSRGDESLATKHATWVLVAPKTQSLLEHPAFAEAAGPTAHDLEHGPLWTDQHHNLVSVLKLW